jgi:DNA-binding NtrC family response regulator
VHGFNRPLAALAALPDLRPGVVVTDYFMPQIDGLEFIRRATPVVPGASFLIITGHNLTTHAEQLGRLTALRSVMAKPLGWRKLAAEVLRWWPAGVATPCPTGEDPSI